MALTAPLVAPALVRRRRDDEPPGGLPPMGLPAPRLAAAAIVFGYEWVSRARWGRTLGERAAGIAVVPARGGPLGWRSAGVRAATDVVPALIPVAGGVLQLTDSLWPLLDRDRRRTLSDRLAGTVVVESPERRRGR